MRTVRRHLRSGAATWLVCHVLAFSALVPRDCCAAHAHSAAAPTPAAAATDHAGHDMSGAAAHAHHQAAAPAHADGAPCPMRGEDGTPCPMHDGASSPAACQMTGVCNQPAAALAAVLMQAAVPPAPFALVPRVAQVIAPRASDEPRHSLAVPPDSPPPRP
jgi:hypothetical protein